MAVTAYDVQCASCYVLANLEDLLASIRIFFYGVHKYFRLGIEHLQKLQEYVEMKAWRD